MQFYSFLTEDRLGRRFIRDNIFDWMKASAEHARLMYVGINL
jgi:hypothetical protein